MTKGTKPVPAILLTILVQGIGIAMWTWGSGQALRLHSTMYGFSGAWLGVMLIGVLGAVIVGLAGLASRLSPAGLLVVGVVHVVASVAFTLMPLTGSLRMNPLFDLAIAIRRLSASLSDGLVMLMATGTGMVLGAWMIGLGLSRGRSRVAGGGGSGVSVVLGVATAGLAIGTLLAGGWTYLQVFIYLSPSIASVLVGLLCAVGLAICLAAMANPRLGGLLAAAVLVVAGLSVASPAVLLGSGLPRPLVNGMLNTVASGGLLSCGIAVGVLCLTVRAAAPAKPWHPADASTNDWSPTGPTDQTLR